MKSCFTFKSHVTGNHFFVLLPEMFATMCVCDPMIPCQLIEIESLLKEHFKPKPSYCRAK